MTLLQLILAWSQKQLATWQRDALRRLFVSASGKLTSTDIEDLAALLKLEHGIPDPAGRTPVLLNASHLPASSVPGAQVVLRSMRDLKDVNRIADNQVLEFSATGMTIIYGGNGSGKSGYSRVLKKACRARDPEETIYADLTVAAGVTRTPEASFAVDVGDTPRVLRWKQTDASPPEELSRIAVFDTRCARSYLDDEDDVAFLPYGLHMVEALGREIMPAVSALLETEIQSINIDMSPFADLAGPTATGQLCASLSATCDVERVKAAGTLSTDEVTRLRELSKSLAERDPAAKAKDLRRAAQRLMELSVRIEQKAVIVGEDALGTAKKIDDETEHAIQAQATAAAAFRAEESLLPGSGEALWKELFRAAERYATEAAYNGQPFPHEHGGMRCVLCQEVLTPNGLDRMRRFAEYVRDDVATRASSKAAERTECRRRLQNASVDIGLTAALADELKSLDASLLSTTQAEAEVLESRRLAMISSFDSHNWSLPALGKSKATELLITRRDAILREASDLERLSDPEARGKLVTEHAELAAREKLHTRLTAVLALISKMKTKAVLVRCRNAIKTKPVSDKAKDFASNQVTGALKTALDTEFVALGVANIRTRIKERAVQGKMKHKLVLDIPNSVDLSLVLSEGEQRAVAIGAFLAELGMAGHSEGIIFDDPVSSLDHHRRKCVARRLVEESAKRQVIVFTHDTVFLGELRALLELKKTPNAIHHLEWQDSRPGTVRDGLPWDHMGYKERLEFHKRAEQRLAKSWSVYPNQDQVREMRQEYGRLRATTERVVEEVVLNGVLRRYTDYIQPGKLDTLASLPKPACDEIKRIYQKCHGITEAHDPASGATVSVPTPAELGKDIADLQAAIQVIIDARKLAVP